jgi:uncharacterized protein
MEPIRPESSRPYRRRLRAGRDGIPSGAGDNAFAQRLTPAAAAETESEPTVAAGVDESAFAGLPGMDAPTERLFDAVHQAGQRLVDERTFTAAQQYREAIRRFLGSVLPGANAVEVHESNHDILARKRYFLLTEVNRSVDRLIQGVLQTQGTQLDILTRLEEIEGLLVDLVR